MPGTSEYDGLLDALLESLPVALAVLDLDGRLVRTSPTFATSTGSTSDQLLGRDVADVLGGQGPAVREAFELLVAQQPSEPVAHVGQAAHDHRDVLVPLRVEGVLAAVALLRLDLTEQRGHERAQAAADARLELTARASTVLGTSLDPDETLEHLCDVLVPALGDHVFVDLREEGGRLRRRAIRHAPGTDVPAELLRAVGTIPDYAPGHPVRLAAEEGRTTLIEDVVEDASSVPPGADARLVAAIGVVSAVVVPMLVAGRPIGTVSLLTSVSGRHFSAGDGTLAQEVISRGAVSLANALSYEQQREAAVSLQRSLLPRTLPALEGVEVAWRYVPGTAGTQVGGDFAEAFELPGGRVAAVVGDVMGRGLRAAAVMGQVRTAVRTLAMTDPMPRDLLARLDEVVAGLPSGQIVTCAYVVYDPARGSVCLANAGHLPPVLIRGGRWELLTDAVSVPLGVGALGDDDFSQTELDLPSGAVVALYTDGLVERPGADLDLAIAALAERLVASGPGLEDMCDGALAAAPRETDRGFDDDVALLLLMATAEQDGRVLTVVLPAQPESAARARAEVSAAMASWGLDDPGGHHGRPLEVAELLVSEVVTNAVRYSLGPIELQIRRGDTALWFEIADKDTRLPRLRHARGDDEGGRGLELVQALAGDWGTREIADGKVVWFRLDV